MAKNTPAFQFYPSDFLSGTEFLSASSVGIYIRIMCKIWIAGGSVPNCKVKLARVCMVSSEEFCSAWDEIEEKFEIVDGMLTQPRLSKIIEISKIRSESGRAGGKPTGKGSGQIYFAKRLSDGHTKIGLSKNALKRISGLKSRHGDMEAIEIIDVQDMDSSEKVAHSIAIEFRTTGEWFDIPDAEIGNVIDKFRSGISKSGKANVKRTVKADLKNEERSMKNEVEDWVIPDGWDTPELRKALDDFEAMRRRIKKPIRSKASTSKMFKRFDSVDHLIRACEECEANEWQGLKAEYGKSSGKLSGGSTTSLPTVSDDDPELKKWKESRNAG